MLNSLPPTNEPRPAKRAPQTAAQRADKAQLRADPFGLELGDLDLPTDFDVVAMLTGGSMGAAAPSAGSAFCSICGGDLRCEIDGLRRVCAVCANIVEGDSTEPEDDDVPRAAAGASRLKLVGVGSSSLQPEVKCQTPATTRFTSAIGSMNFQARFMS